MNTVKSWIRWLWDELKHNYRFRITVAVAILLMMFLVVGFTEMFLFAENILLDKSHDFMRSEATSCSANIENNIARIEDVTLNILGDTNIQSNLNMLLADSQDEHADFLYGENIRASLSGYTLYRTEISSIYIVGKNDEIYSYSKSRAPIFDNILSQQEQIYELKGKTTWFVSDSDCTALSCARAINYFPHFTTMGFVSVNISESYIRSLYSELISPGVGDVFLVDENHVVISSYDGNHMGQTIGDEFTELLKSDQESYHVLDNGDSIYVSEKMPNKWRLMLTVPASYYLEGLDNLGTIFIISAAVIMLLAFLLLHWITMHLTRPIKELARAMEDFGAGNVEAHYEVTTQDEIGMLGNTFNKMIADMHQLYLTAYEQQILRQDAELRALQMQINPHFLYNTLDTINWKARFSGVDDVGEMAYCLGCLLRHSLAPGDFTILSKELASLEYYLKIQDYRYSDRLTVELDVDPSFHNIDVPKLLLQPIVENAIVHGIEEKIEGGTVRIWAELDGKSDFLIHVEDDGMGMAPEIRDKILSGKKEHDFRKKPHIGVYNVHRRIQLYYGEHYGLEIQSASGGGTRVTMRIKALREPEELF